MLTTEKALKREKEILVTVGETIGSKLGSLVAKANNTRKLLLVKTAETARPVRRATRAVKSAAKKARGAVAHHGRVKTRKTARRTARKTRRGAAR